MIDEGVTSGNESDIIVIQIHAVPIHWDYMGDRRHHSRAEFYCNGWDRKLVTALKGLHGLGNAMASRIIGG